LPRRLGRILRQRALAAAEVVFAFIDAPREPDNGRRTIERARGELVFEGVGFRYPGSERAALRGQKNRAGR
jgi:subfamily B ATP-binding cassette protein MsbA